MIGISDGDWGEEKEQLVPLCPNSRPAWGLDRLRLGLDSGVRSPVCWKAGLGLSSDLPGAMGLTQWR